MGSEQQSTCQNKNLPPVARIGGEGRTNNNSLSDKVWMWKPLFFSHFSIVSTQFGPNLGRAFPADDVISDGVGLLPLERAARL